MEITIREETSGREEVMEVGLEETVGELRGRVVQLFDVDRGVTLMFAGLANKEDTLLSEAGALSQGCTVSFVAHYGKYCGALFLHNGREAWAATPAKVKLVHQVSLTALVAKVVSAEGLPKELLASTAFVTAAASIDASVLRYATLAVRSDKQTVLPCVKEDGTLLQYVSPALKADKDVVLEAIGSNPTARAFADPATLQQL